MRLGALILFFLFLLGVSCLDDTTMPLEALFFLVVYFFVCDWEVWLRHLPYLPVS